MPPDADLEVDDDAPPGHDTCPCGESVPFGEECPRGPHPYRTALGKRRADLRAERIARAAFRSQRPEGHARWVESSLGRAIEASEAMLVELLCKAFRVGPWNLTPWTTLATAGPHGAKRTLRDRRDLSTFDTDALTRLVILAHDLAIRVEIRPAMHNVRVLAHQRTREGSLMHRHPTIEEAIADVRRGRL